MKRDKCKQWLFKFIIWSLSNWEVMWWDESHLGSVLICGGSLNFEGLDKIHVCRITHVQWFGGFTAAVLLLGNVSVLVPFFFFGDIHLNLQCGYHGGLPSTLSTHWCWERCIWFPLTLNVFDVPGSNLGFLASLATCSQISVEGSSQA